MATPYYVDALLAPDQPHWAGDLKAIYQTDGVGQAATITYGFLTDASSLTGKDALNFTPFNDAQKAALREAVKTWSAVANITFVETADATKASIRVGNNQQTGSGAYASYPYDGGGVLLANNTGKSGTSNAKPDAGTFGFYTLVHELGHSIGLKHPGDYNGDQEGSGVTPGPYLPTAEDDFSNSVMSYKQNSSLAKSYGPVGPSIYDVAAAQYLYGANMNTAPGNDTYTANPTGNFLTIWDPNGTNTLDGGAQSANESFSLVGGGKCWVGDTLVAGVCFGTKLQVAKGGSGDDTFYANTLGDSIDGGAGENTVVFAGKSTDYSMGWVGGALQVSFNGAVSTLNNIGILTFDDKSMNAADVTGGPILAGSGVYRFFNTLTKQHFFTSTPAERDTIQATLPDYKYEGAMFGTINPSYPGAAPVYRFNNPTNGSHFYTISAAEKDGLIANNKAWQYEGVAFSAFSPSDLAIKNVPGLQPLYRFYRPAAGSHFFTTSTAERDNIINTMSGTYSYEGVAFYVTATPPGAAPPELQAGAGAIDAGAVAATATATGGNDWLASAMGLGADDPFAGLMGAGLSGDNDAMGNGLGAAASTLASVNLASGLFTSSATDRLLAAAGLAAA